MKKDNENAKDKRWQVPVDLPGVKPEDYPVKKPEVESDSKSRSNMKK